MINQLTLEVTETLGVIVAIVDKLSFFPPLFFLQPKSTGQTLNREFTRKMCFLSLNLTPLHYVISFYFLFPERSVSMNTCIN